MRKRAFLGLLGGAAAWPLAVRAQQLPLPTVGYLTSLGRNDRSDLVDALRRGLSEAGYVEGRNVAIESRFAGNQYDRLPALAADLVDRKVAVIIAGGGGVSVLAAKARGSAGSMHCSAARRSGCCRSSFPMPLSSL